jgi:hypothetical protein
MRAEIVRFEQLSKLILNTNRNVRSIVIINQSGIVIHSSIHQKFTQPSFERWNDIHFMDCSYEISLGENFDELYGPIRYHFSEKDDYIMFSFPIRKNSLLVTCTKNIPPIAFATEVSHLINKVIGKII